MKEKTYVEDVNRSIYDIRNEEKDVYRVKEGLTPEIVDQISKEKHDPALDASCSVCNLCRSTMK